MVSIVEGDGDAGDGGQKKEQRQDAAREREGTREREREERGEQLYITSRADACLFLLCPGLEIFDSDLPEKKESESRKRENEPQRPRFREAQQHRSIRAAARSLTHSLDLSDDQKQNSKKQNAADIISAVEFDADGSHLATGDRGGRVVLFERVAASSSQDGNDGAAEEGGTPIDVEVDGGEGESGAAASTSGYNNNNSEQNPDVRPRNPNSSSSCPPFEYRYLTEFQSHEPEFDYLKSLEIEEKINKVRWARRNVAGSSNKDALASSSSRAAAADSANGRLLLSTNDKTIKLWRVYDRRVVTLAGFNTARGALGGLGSGGAVGGLMSSGGGGSGGRGDLIGVGRMPPVAAGAGDGTGEGEEEASPSSGAGATTAAAAAEAAANPRPPPGTTPWSIAVSARSSEPRAPRPPPPAPPSSSGDEEEPGATTSLSCTWQLS